MVKTVEVSNTDAEFTLAYRSLYPFIVKYCQAKLGGSIDDAEECAQETFFILYRKYRNNVKIENPKAFLIKTANYIILKKLSSKHSDTVYIDEVKSEIAENDTSEIRFGNVEYNELVELIKNKLGEPDKTIFVLRYIEEQSLKEISEKTGLSITNITTRMTRFRTKIRDEINKWRG